MCNNYLIRVMAVLSLMLVVNTISYADVVDITLCDIKADFDLEHDNIDIITHLELTKPETLKTFNLMLSSDVEIHTLKCIVNSQSYDISWDFIGNDTIHLIFSPDVPPKKDLMLEIEYTFSIKPYKEEVLVLGRGHRWYPHAFDDITTYQFLITVPKDYIVITSGDLIKNEKTSNQSQYKWRTNIPVFKLPIIITKPEFYSIINKEIDNNTISLYTFTADEEVREIIINEIQQSFVFYEGLIGEYHHKCLTFIEIPDFPTINISSGLVMFGPKYTDEYKEGRYGRFILPVVHQWYSAGLFFELFGKGFWFFQMSMPWYLRYMYIQETDGDSVFSEALNKDLQYYQEIENTDDEIAILDVDFVNTSVKNAVIYGKGPYVVHMIRNLMGDQEWRNFIRGFYTKYKGTIVTYDNFIEILSQYDKKNNCIPTLEKLLSEKGLTEE